MIKEFDDKTNVADWSYNKPYVFKFKIPFTKYAVYYRRDWFSRSRLSGGGSGGSGYYIRKKENMIPHEGIGRWIGDKYVPLWSIND